MSKKRRVFDIDFDAIEEPVPAGTEAQEPAADARRGPMATAISENAAALSERQKAEARIREENDRLAHEYVALKKQGLIVALVPLDEISATKLTRDRAATRDDEIDELKASIRAVGLSNPIRVEQVDGGYELVQGWRRLTAYRELYAETGDEAYARIPAGLLARGAALEELYQRMVDENLVRRDISFAEMARLALAYVNDPNTEARDPKDAVNQLYASAGRQKRNYITHFVTLVEALGDALQYPEAIPRRLGLDLVKRLDEDRDLAARLRVALEAHPQRDAEAELAILRGGLKPVPAGTGRTGGQGGGTSAKTVIRLDRPEGQAKCTAANGRLEITLGRDFSAMDRRRLEAAIQAMFKALDE